MRKAKYLLLAAIVSTSVVGATQTAAAEVSAVAVVQVPDGEYPVRDQNGRIIGYITIRNNQVVASRPAN